MTMCDSSRRNFKVKGEIFIFNERKLSQFKTLIDGDYFKYGLETNTLGFDKSKFQKYISLFLQFLNWETKC